MERSIFTLSYIVAATLIAFDLYDYSLFGANLASIAIPIMLISEFRHAPWNLKFRSWPIFGLIATVLLPFLPLASLSVCLIVISLALYANTIKAKDGNTEVDHPQSESGSEQSY